MRAACDLVKALECSVLQCIVLIELSDLNGRKNVPVDMHSFLKYTGDS